MGCACSRRPSQRAVSQTFASWGWRALGVVARFRLGPLPVRRARSSATEPGRRHRAERDLKIGILLAFLDPLTGLGFLQRARTQLARAGADAQAAGCDWLCCILALVGSARADRVPLADRYDAAACARAAGQALPPDVRMLQPAVAGVRAMRAGRWRESRDHFDHAVETSLGAKGTTEAAMARSFAMMSAAHEQDLPECKRRVDWFRTHEAECGGTVLAAHLGLVQGYVELLEGRFDASYATVTRAAAVFDDEGRPNAQRASKLVFRHLADIYRDARSARRELSSQLERARRYRFFRTMYAGLYASLVAITEANALRVGDPDASQRRVEAFAAIADRAPPISAGAEWRARAYAADARGESERAIDLLLRAEQASLACERRVDAAIARWQRGRRLGGASGATLRSAAERALLASGVSTLVLEEDAGLR